MISRYDNIGYGPLKITSNNILYTIQPNDFVNQSLIIDNNDIDLNGNGFDVVTIHGRQEFKLDIKIRMIGEKAQEIINGIDNIKLEYMNST